MRLDSERRRRAIPSSGRAPARCGPNLALLIAVAGLLAGTSTTGAETSSESELAQAVNACNKTADDDGGKRKHMRACETLAKEGRLSLAEPAAAEAYRRYQDELQRRQAAIESSPRGQSRGR